MKICLPVRLALLCSVVALPLVALAQDTAADRAAWLSALQQDSPSSFETYLANYPTGAFASLAFRCLIEHQLLIDIQRCSVEDNIGPPAESHVTSGNIPIQLN